MEFINYKCPVCDKQFVSGDDIVVCPECGTPHHRECYETLEHCFNEDKHSQNFSFEQDEDKDEKVNENNEEKNTSSDTVICPNCKEENPKTSFYCNRCGAPLNEQDKSANNVNGQNVPPYGMPFDPNFQQVNNIMFDPMAGFKNDDEIGENVTAGEMSKFIGKTTPYFLRVFGNIKRFDKSKFNFCSFFFCPIYFFYRKMNLIGGIFSAIVLLLTVASTLIQLTPDYQALYNLFASNMENASASYSLGYSMYFDGMSTNQMMFFCLPSLIELVQTAIMFICGFITNRLYYKHCVKKINSIKAQGDEATVNKTLADKGGVNLPLAVCTAVTFFIITQIPTFMQLF